MISTHTLTWSVTTAVLFHAVQLIISTHTLTWSVTAIYCADDRYTDYFNSHAHVERDDNALCVIIDFHISTHTLTWSVTEALFQFLSIVPISTHTLTWSVTQQSSRNTLLM